MKRPLVFLGLLLITAPASHADLGRLFYTPEQRQQLEQARMHNRTQASAAPAEVIATPLTYDGVVIRSDGRSTRWTNGKPQPGGAYTLHRRGISLKPGQTLYGQKIYEAHDIRRPETKVSP